jgi:DNA-binding transcriptional LysR family regulator
MPGPVRADLLDGLVAFCLVAEKRSFTAAAAELRVTRSAVSQAVKTLETRLGVALLARTTRDVGLTQAGEGFLAAVRPAVQAIAVATETVSAFGGRPAGLLRLNVPRVAVATVIAPLLPGFAAAYPDVTVEIFTEDRLANIVEGGFDAGVRLGELVERDMVSVRLTSGDRLVVTGSPAYFARHGHPATPRHLAGHACINFRQSSRGGLYRWEFEHAGEEFDVAVDGGIIVNDTDMKLRAAIDGLGLAYELESVVRPFVEMGALALTLEAYAASTPGFYLYFPARSQVLPKLRAFVEFARHRSREGTS